ncbi:MAG: SpoIIE family protein phosphatase [Oscillospiraceae bacterium]|nr:SpoIIE family protein phosphatase [Oscillospiraceae bacterium]
MGQAVREQQTEQRRKTTGGNLQIRLLAAVRRRIGALCAAMPKAWRKLRPWAAGFARCGVCAAAAAVVLPGNIAPFGLALCIAVPQQAAFLCSVCCALGGFAALPVPLAMGQAAGALLIGALRLVLGRQNAFWAGVAGVTVCSMLSQTAAAMGQPQAGPLRWLVQGCLVLALALFYREVRPDGLFGEAPRRQAVRMAVWTSIGCALAVLPSPWLGCAVGFVSLVLCALERPARLTLVWAAAALGGLAAHADLSWLPAGLFAAWAASCFGGRRRVMAAVWWGAGLLGIFTAADLPALGALLLANACTAAAFCLLPERFFLRLDEMLTAAEERSCTAPVRALQALACGLRAIGNGVEAVGRAAAQPPEDPNAPVETVCRQVCSACTQKARCWGAGYDDTQNAMQGFLDGWRKECKAEFAPWFICTRQSAVRTALLRAENLRVLRRAGQAEAGVLRGTVSGQYRAMADGLYRMAESWQPDSPQPHLTSRLQALTETMQLPVRQLAAVRRPDGSLAVTLQLRSARLSDDAAQQLTAAVSRLCGTPMQLDAAGGAPDGGSGQMLCFEPVPFCGVETGAASRAYKGVCGDVTEELQHGGNCCLVLCDGMGTGADAAVEAKLAALFTARLLRAGFEEDVAARLVNAALLARAPGDQGSTLDVLRIRGADGRAFIYKAGACPGYLVRGTQVRRLGAEDGNTALGLPLGAAGTVRDWRLEVSLVPGDLLVLASDGLFEQGEAVFLRALRALQPDTPQRMAQALLDACAAAPQDDCTVLLARITAGRKKYR